MLQAPGSPAVSLPSLSQFGSPGPSGFALRGPSDLASHAVESPQGPMNSHPVEDDGVPSFAINHDLGSPVSSVGSVGNRAGVTVPQIDLHKMDGVDSPRSPHKSGGLEAEDGGDTFPGDAENQASALNTSRTPLSSHAVAASSDSDSQLLTGRTPLSSHAVNASSSSGSGSDDGYPPSTAHHEDMYI